MHKNAEGQYYELAHEYFLFIFTSVRDTSLLVCFELDFNVFCSGKLDDYKAVFWPES